MYPKADAKVNYLIIREYSTFDTKRRFKPFKPFEPFESFKLFELLEAREARDMNELNRPLAGEENLAL